MPSRKPVISIRRPPAEQPDPTAVERFVTGDSKIEDTDRTTASTFQRRDGQVLRRMMVYLPADLAKRLRIHCAEHDRRFSEVVSKAVERYLAS